MGGGRHPGVGGGGGGCGGWQTPTVEHQDSAFIVLCNTHLMQHRPEAGIQVAQRVRQAPVRIPCNGDPFTEREQLGNLGWAAENVENAWMNPK